MVARGQQAQKAGWRRRAGVEEDNTGQDGGGMLPFIISGLEGDLGRLSETLPPDRYMKDSIDLLLKVL